MRGLSAVSMTEVWFSWVSVFFFLSTANQTAPPMSTAALVTTRVRFSVRFMTYYYIMDFWLKHVQKFIYTISLALALEVSAFGFSLLHSYYIL